MGYEDVAAGKAKQIKGKANDVAAPSRETPPSNSKAKGKKPSAKPRKP